MWRSALYQVDPNVSTALAWRMMVFNPDSVRLVLPHLIGLKQLHLDWTSVVPGWVYFWIISACPPLLIASLIKTGPSQYSLLASRIDLACRLSLIELCFFVGKQSIDATREKIAYWHCNWHDYRFPHTCYHGNLQHMFSNLIHWALDKATM